MGRRWRKKYEVPAYLYGALRHLKPPDDISVSEWAEECRVLSARESSTPGPWRNAMVPYLVSIMNELINYETEEIILCSGAQMGKTELILILLGYIIMQDPGPTLLVYPTEDTARYVSADRIRPMVESTAGIREMFQPLLSQKTELRFENQVVYLAGSNSPADLASKPIRYVLLDEIDKFPGASKKEAEPISLARMRTTTYGNGKGRKLAYFSTPTITTGQIWKALLNADVVRHFFVPCPHCGRMIELKWSQMRWPEPDKKAGEEMSLSEMADEAVYICQECGCPITEAHKSQMLNAGEWQIVTERNKVHRRVGYWISSLYSPFISFSELVLEYLQSKGDPEQEQNFVNSRLAEPWEETQVKTDAEDVLDRQTDLPEFVVPDWAELLTAGVDVQETSLYYTIRAWGEYTTSQNITHGQADSWAEIERVMNLLYTKADGTELGVELCLVDSGYNADITYEFCVDHADWALPVKGATNINGVNDYRVSVVNRPGSRAHGRALVLAKVDEFKSRIAYRLRLPPGRGSWMVYDGCDRDYAEQVTSEHRVTQRSGGIPVTRWVKKHSHADNHYLDCEVYAYVAAHIRGVRSLHLNRADALMAPAPGREPDAAEETVDAASWIDTEGSWLGDATGWLGG